MFARVVLKAEVTKRTYLATGIIVAGVLLLVMFSNQDSKQYTFRELQVRGPA